MGRMTYDCVCSAALQLRPVRHHHTGVHTADSGETHLAEEELKNKGKELKMWEKIRRI